MRRRTLVAAGLLAALAIAFVATLWATGPVPGATEENANRLALGMSRGRVERILGSPYNQVRVAKGYSEADWETGDYHVRVIYDRDERLNWVFAWKDGRGSWEDLHPEPTLLDRLRALLPF